MTRAYLLIDCACEFCTVANTQAVRPPGTQFVEGKLRPAEVLHGTHATGYLRAYQRGTERVGEIGARLRADLLKGQR